VYSKLDFIGSEKFYKWLFFNICYGLLARRARHPRGDSAGLRNELRSILEAPPLSSTLTSGLTEWEKYFSKKTVKHITDFDAKHLKGVGFRENIFFISI